MADLVDEVKRQEDEIKAMWDRRDLTPLRRVMNLVTLVPHPEFKDLRIAPGTPFAVPQPDSEETIGAPPP